jgi:DNA-binding response OmpR family regulator
MAQTVLIIDDNPLVREVVRQMLQARGYAVLVAEEGRAGLRQLAKNEVDVAIVDVDMPLMNGVEVCTALREQAAAAGRTLPVWLMTGVTRPELVEGAERAGAAGILAKPFTTAELIACVEGALRSAGRNAA